MKKNRVKFVLMIFVALTYGSSSLGQVTKNLIEISPLLSSRYFNWGEYGDASKKLLEEEGYLYGGGLTSKFKFSRDFELYTRFDAYLHHGLVDYNGFLQNPDGTTEPYKSQTGYLWAEFLLNFGYDFYLAKHFTLAPELGLQYEYWNRDIDNGGKYGYDEKYNMLLLAFGCNFIFPFTSSSKVFLNVLGEYPLLVNENVDLASRGQGGPTDINLEPIANIGVNCELGGSIGGWLFSLYYDYLTYSKSGLDQGFFQPESDRSILGMKFGYTF